jgi:hypothetical protein
VCDYGASLSLEELFQPGRLGACPGERPWIVDRDPAPCTPIKGLRLLTRSATNTYFPQIARVISLPQAVDDLARNIEAVWTDVSECRTADDVKQAKKFNSVVRANLQIYSDEDILARIIGLADDGARGDAAEDPKIAEYQLLASGRPLIGVDSSDAYLHAATLPRAVWDPDGDPDLAGIGGIVAVHRLREVVCLYGFTRFEPAPLANDDLEDVGLAVRGAPLGQTPDWLPSIEQFGEGVFVQFSPEALANWLSRTPVLERARHLREGVKKWADAKRFSGGAVSQSQMNERARPEYIMAHSLAHALMSEVAIDCGYPASSLKERIYLLPRLPGQPIRCGILIYTASAGNQGTLGGLRPVKSSRTVRPLPSISREAATTLVLIITDPRIPCLGARGCASRSSTIRHEALERAFGEGSIKGGVCAALSVGRRARCGADGAHRAAPSATLRRSGQNARTTAGQWIEGELIVSLRRSRAERG